MLSEFLFIHIGLNPVAFSFGAVAIHWYGIGYVVAILVGLNLAKRYALTHGVTEEQFWAVAFWAVMIGFIGGRLYYVVQNDFLGYLTHPFRIFQIWNGGMAYFGAIFAATGTIAVFAWRKHWSFAAMLDTAAIFALVGQPIGRLGNVVNGDILGPPTHVPWGFIYTNPASFAPSNTTPYHPAAIYEIIANLALIAILIPLSRRLRPGWLAASYIAGYCITQLIVFHWRTEPIVGLGLRQAQWTALIVLAADVAAVAVMVIRRRNPRRQSALSEATT